MEIAPSLSVRARKQGTEENPDEQSIAISQRFGAAVQGAIWTVALFDLYPMPQWRGTIETRKEQK